MSDDDRLQRIEQRLAVLEGLVRQLMPLLGQRPTPPPVPSSPTPPTAPRERDAEPTRPPPPPPRPIAAPADSARPGVMGDAEQWFGQRGLLAVGVVFVVLAAGYLLKYSFDRGWVSPLMRCTGGVLAGVAVGALGWRLEARGLRTYGAALVGCGAAIVYLAAWAASRLYGFLPPPQGIVALALVSLSLAAIAYAVDLEALGAVAALGAFLAPVVLGSERVDHNLLLLYLGFMGVGLGWVAARKHWRLATAIVTLSYFGLTIGGVEGANPVLLLAFALLGGSAGLSVGLREGWWETRLMAFAGGWALLGAADDKLVVRWPIGVGAAILAAPVWWRALHAPTVWPTRDPAEPVPATSLGESFFFYLTPVLLGWAAAELAPARVALDPGLPALLVAIPYLGMGFSALRPPFALVGTSAAGLAVLSQWSGLPATWGLLALALVWAALDHLLHRNDGRWYSLLAGAGAVAHLFGPDLSARLETEAAFSGRWAVALWLAVMTLSGLAAGIWKREQADTATGRIPAGLWAVSGVLLLFGVTGELNRYFALSTLDAQSASLANGLAVSAWWITFAGALILVGFRRRQRLARVAGLLVAGMAVLKVVFYDLSSLDALYRVGSVLVLGLVSLALAYVYHRKGPAGDRG